jgi:thioredoxin 1
MSKPFHVSNTDFENRVLQAAQPVVVDFWAAWCGPCLMMAPVLEALAAELDGQVGFAKLDVDANPDLAELHGVGGIPTLIVFENGKEAGRIVGYMPKEAILSRLRAMLPLVPLASARVAQ